MIYCPKRQPHISPEDANELGIANGEKICVTSRRGEVVVTARVTQQVPKGLVWMAFHFREACANWLTNPVFDPVTRTADTRLCRKHKEGVKSRILTFQCNQGGVKETDAEI